MTLSIAYERDGERVEMVIDQPYVVLGRAASCDVVLPFDAISRRHAHIEERGGDWFIADLGSLNGTQVNGESIRGRRKLRHGDRVTLHSVTLSVRFGTAADRGPEDEADLDVTAKTVVFDESPMGDDATFVAQRSVEQLLELESAAVEPDPGLATRPAGRAAAQEPPKTITVPTRGGGWALDLSSKLAEALLLSEDLDGVLDQIMDLAFEHSPAQRGVICLRQNGSDELRTAVVRGGSDDHNIRVSTKVAHSVIHDRQAFLIREVAGDERFTAQDTIVKMRVRSAVCAPLYYETEVRGLIYLDTTADGMRFQDSHMKLISALGLFAAIGIKQMQFREEIRHQQAMRARLERYSSPAVVDRIADAELEAMSAEEREVTVLFCDLYGFTALAESLSPQETASILNTIFDRLTAVVFEHEGTLDKYTGDGMMVFFGAPLEQPDHAARATRAAWEMREELAVINRELHVDRPLQMRFGVNTGAAVVGDIGADRRRDYTVIGDTVNVASRMEHAIAKPGDIAITESTYTALAGEFGCEALAPVHVRNRKEPVRPYRVTSWEGSAAT